MTKCKTAETNLNVKLFLSRLDETKERKQRDPCGSLITFLMELTLLLASRWLGVDLLNKSSCPTWLGLGLHCFGLTNVRPRLNSVLNFATLTHTIAYINNCHCKKKRSQKKSQECFLYCFINALVSYIILLRSDMSVDNQMLQWLRDSFRRVYFGFFNWFHSGLICYQLVFQSWLTWRCSATVRTAITISSRDSGRGTRWQLTTPCRPSGSTMIWPSQLLNRVRLWHTPWLVYMTIQGMQVEEKVESAILKIQFCMIIIVLSNEK